MGQGEEKPIRVYLCKDSLEGILSAVYMAYMSRYGHPWIRIAEGENRNYELFCQYETVETDLSHAVSVAESVKTKISYDAWHILSQAALHERQGKAQDIYRFLNYGYVMGGKVIDFLKCDPVRRVVYDSKTVAREKDRLMGFVRFSQLKDGSLFGRIAPKHNQIPLLARHFADRFPEERWILYDERRKLAAVHVPEKGFYLLHREIRREETESNYSAEEIQMKNWWNSFFDAIGIDARENRKLQQQMMPLYYQKYMHPFETSKK
ncbi:MAG: TIGR03915 family putative DNA repair protein [Lachnospiraceae bacterium]|nr:TIGR03915 family putative DNA repair protein [Lachnospiraceae bacterium]